MPPVGLNIAAQGRNLEALAVDNGGHRAVFDSGRYGFDRGPFQQFNDGLGRVGGGNVDIDNRPLGKGIADATADEPDLCAVGLQGVDHSLRLRS